MRAKHETQFKNKFGFSAEEQERLALTARLLRVPPELPRMREIIRRRLKH